MGKSATRKKRIQILTEKRTRIDEEIATIARKEGIDLKPKDLEKRLSNAYDAGFFDGYHDGTDDAHKIWVSELKNVKGIGPHLCKQIMSHMTEAIQRRHAERNLTKETINLAKEN